MTLIATGAGGLWRKSRKIVPASSSINAETIPITLFKGIRYVLYIQNESEDVYKSIEMLTTKTSGGQVEDNIFANLGDSLNFQTKFYVSGSDVVLELTNGELYPLTVSLNKLVTN